MLRLLLRAVPVFRKPFDDVRRCPGCRRGNPCPMQWEPVGDEHWWIRLRCGECGHWYETTITNERASRLDAELDGDARAIRRDLERLPQLLEIHP